VQQTNARLIWVALLTCATGGILTACSDSTSSPGPDAGSDTAKQDTATKDTGSDLASDAAGKDGAPVGDASTADSATTANPASVYCVQQGGTLDLRSNAAGQYGVCKLNGGGECEEWAFYRDQCKPGDCTTWESCRFDGGAALDGGKQPDGGNATIIDGGIDSGVDSKPALDTGTSVSPDALANDDVIHNVANPASLNCTNKGGTLELRDEADGVYGVCKFSDGSECEEWAYYQGQCHPGQCVEWETCSAG